MAVGRLRAQGLSRGCWQPTRGRAGGGSPGLCLPTKSSQWQQVPWFCLLRSLEVGAFTRVPCLGLHLLSPRSGLFQKWSLAIWGRQGPSSSLVLCTGPSPCTESSPGARAAPGLRQCQRVQGESAVFKGDVSSTFRSHHKQPGLCAGELSPGGSVSSPCSLFLSACRGFISRWQRSKKLPTQELLLPLRCSVLFLFAFPGCR